MKILLVEDDVQIARVLKLNLELDHYKVIWANTVQSAKDSIKQNQPIDLLLLDIHLPDGNGFDLLHEIRASGCQSPALFLSARTDEESVVKAMNIGAEDYLRKPFGVEELKARMKRCQKRSEVSQGWSCGPLQIDFDQRIASIDGVPLDLSRREFDILAFLSKTSPNVQSREMIMDYLNYDDETFDRTIDSHISRLRKKLSSQNEKGLKIISVYGVGYKLHGESS